MFYVYNERKGKAEQVQIIEVPDQPILEDVGEEPKEKVVEELETVQIDESNPEKFFLLGTSLTHPTRKDANARVSPQKLGSVCVDPL